MRKWFDLYLEVLLAIVATCVALVAVPLLLRVLYALAKKLLLGA